MTPEFHKMIAEECRFARTMGMDPWEYLEKKGLLASPGRLSSEVRSVIDKLLTLLEYDVTPYILAALAGQEGQTTATNVHKGVIEWLTKIREEFQ